MNDYPLKTLMQIREQERDARENAYKEALVTLEALRQNEQSQRDVWNEALRQVAMAREKAKAMHQESEILMSDVAFQREYELGLKAQVEFERDKLEKVAKKVQEFLPTVELRKKELTHAQRELLAVEKHYETWLEEQKIEMDRKQSDQLDEVAMRTWGKS